MTFLEKLRKRWEARRREHEEKEAEELAAGRGETYTTHGHKDALTPPHTGLDPPPGEWPAEP